MLNRMLAHRAGLAAMAFVLIVLVVTANGYAADGAASPLFSVQMAQGDNPAQTSAFKS